MKRFAHGAASSVNATSVLALASILAVFGSTAARCVGCQRKYPALVHHFFKVLSPQRILRIPQIEKLALFLEAHRFRSDFGGLAFGREIDASVSYPLSNNMVVKLQQAQFAAGSGARANNDVDKTWLAATHVY